MVDPSWKRIAAIHAQEDGIIGAVWLAHDRTFDVLHLDDACVFQREVLAVIAEGLVARGRWIPIAWPQAAADIAKNLLDRGCNMLVDHVDDSPAIAEVLSRDLEERMRSGRLKVDKRLQNWQDEFRSFFREEGQVPQTSFPLMSATRHAVAMLEYARGNGKPSKPGGLYPKVAIV